MFIRTARDWQEAAQRVRADGPLKVSKAARLVPADTPSGTAGPGTLVRWILRGKRGVYLDGARFSGKTWWTSAAALDRFFAAVAAGEAAECRGPGETNRERERRAEAANRELDELVGV